MGSIGPFPGSLCLSRWLRTDLIAELGEELPDTWEDVHRIGKKLKAKGIR